MDIQIVIDELAKVVNDIVRVIPAVINGIILLIVGYAFAAIVRIVLTFLLRRLGFDALMDRIGVADGLRGIGVSIRFSRLVGRIIFLLLFLSFAATATRVMGLGPLADLLNQLLVYLPSIVGALIVFLLGSLAAKYAGDVIGRVGRNNGLGYAATLGRIIQYAITLFVVVLALGSLGINTSILVTVLTIGVAGFSLAFSLSLGLGARNLVTGILSSYYVRERFPVGRTVRIGEVSGQVTEIGSVNTVVTTNEEIVVIPNATLIRTVVRGAQTPNTQPPQPPSTEPPS